MASDAQMEMEMMAAAGLSWEYGDTISDLPGWDDYDSDDNYNQTETAMAYKDNVNQVVDMPMDVDVFDKLVERLRKQVQYGNHNYALLSKLDDLVQEIEAADARDIPF